MKRLILILLITLPLVAAAQYTLENASIDGGGGTSSGGGWALIVAIGQPDAGTLSGSTWTLEGGVLAGRSVVPEGDFIFSDGFETR